MAFQPKRKVRSVEDDTNADLYEIQTAIAAELGKRNGRLRYLDATEVVQFSDVIRADAPAGGLSLLFPAPAVDNQNGRIYVLTMSANPVTIVPKGGLVNGAATLALAARGLYVFANDSTQWFAIPTGGGGTVDSAALDAAFGSTRGSILERGAAGWQIVVPGTSGFVWTSNGAGADPSYQAAPAATLPDIVSSNHILTSSFTLAADEGAIIPRYHQVNAGAVLTLSAGSTFLIN